MKQSKSLEDGLFVWGLVVLGIGTVALLLYDNWLRPFVPRVPCFFSTRLGIYCPGCGGSRSVSALLHGEFLKAVWYHPLVPYGAVIGGGFLVTQGLYRLGLHFVRPWRFHNWYLYGAVAILVCNFLIKNMLRLIWGIML